VLEIVKKRIDLLEKKESKAKELSAHLSSTRSSIEDIRREVDELEQRLAKS
jgi:5-bromo-4-chloroindolyl phosphate hydrolysis protein